MRLEKALLMLVAILVSGMYWFAGMGFVIDSLMAGYTYFGLFIMILLIAGNCAWLLWIDKDKASSAFDFRAWYIGAITGPWIGNWVLWLFEGG
ncbi:MAG: hypothetical protein AAB646_02985 [Patescibacteria group bacterium]